MTTAKKTSSDMLAAALHYAEQGIPVFPCSQEDKAPLVGGGFHKATTDSNQIKSWWSRWPLAMVGMPTGLVSGIDVLDLDLDVGKRKDGLAEVPDWKDRSPVIVRTPRGGAHLWFKSDGTMRNTADGIAHGVDTRGTGGYVIMPPSQNGAGAYRFEKGSEEEFASLPLFPSDLRARLNFNDEPHTPNEEPEADNNRLAAALDVIPNGDLGWEDWNRTGMAIWGAMGGSNEGFMAFDAWSQKSVKYNPAETRKRWKHFCKSPPTQLGAGSIIYMANAAQPDWEKRYYDALMERLIHPEGNLAFLLKNRTAEKLCINATPYIWRDPAKISPRDFLYGKHLIRKFLSGKVSQGGVGKSSLITAETLAMTSGKNLLGVAPSRRLRVWLWNLEDPKEETERKIQAAALHYGLSPDDLVPYLFVDSGRDQKLVIAETTRDGAKIVRPVVDSLIEQIIARNIDVLIIDPFVSSHHVVENSNDDMDLVVKEWSAIAEFGNCAVELVHHSKKGELEKTVESSRGAIAITDACRSVQVLNRMTKEEAERAGVQNHRLYFRVYADKANLAPPVETSNWFKLESVDLGNGRYFGGLGGDEVGVVVAWRWPDAMAGITDADFEKVAAEIRGGKWRENYQAKDWAGYAVAKALNLDAGSKAGRAKISAMLKVWLAAGSLAIVDGFDEKSMPKKFVEVAENG